MNEETNDYAVDNSTIIRIRHWLQVILKFGEATIRRLTLEHPTFVTEYNAFSTFAKLRYFVKVIMNGAQMKQTCIDSKAVDVVLENEVTGVHS